MARILVFLLLAVQSISSTAQFVSIQNSPLVSETVESSGIAWVDFDHDGDDDIFITTSVQSGLSSLDLLFVNNGDGSFSKLTTGDLVNQNGTGRGSSWADYNNDGYIDVFVVDQLNLTLFKNTDTNVLGRVNGIPSSLIFSTDQDYSSSSWGDYNGDGFLDLFVAAYQLNENGKNVLYQNNGDGSFSTKTGSAFANTSSKSQDVTWIDYNNDHLLDLFISNYGENNSLYQNNGNGTFQKKDISGLTTSPQLSVGSSWADYDNDGDFDVVVIVNANSNNKFFENNGDGTFTEKVNAITSIQATSSSWADYDNDGFIDLVVVGSTTNRKTYLFKNNGDKTFTDVSTSQGIINAGYSQGVAWGDYNKDGFLDMFIVNGYDNVLSHSDILYSNTPNNNKWISVKLKGVYSNKSAIGTVVKVKTLGKTQTQVVQSQTGKNSMNSLNVEFGLGQSTKVDTMLIEWPLKGYQELLNVDANQFLEIQEIEFAEAPTSLVGANQVYKQVNLSWIDNSTGELGFRVERSKGDQKSFKVIGATEANFTEFQDLNLQEGVTYYYRVATKRENGFSVYSNVTAVYMKRNQSVTFAPIGEKYLDSEPFKLSATSSSGLPTNFSILEGQDKVTLAGDVLRIVTLGLSKLGAFQSGNDFYFPSPVAEQLLDVKFITSITDTPDILEVYPNPATDYINFQTSFQREPIRIFNTKGQLVYSFMLTEEYSNIPIGHLPDGLYVVTSKWGVSRFVKEN